MALDKVSMLFHEEIDRSGENGTKIAIITGKQVWQ